jgi:hypothetical protein
MTHHIETDGTEMMRQAAMTAETYLSDAIIAMDDRWGKGFAVAHPELIAAFMRTAATAYAGTIIAQQIRAGLENLGDAVDKIADRNNEAASSSTFHRVAEAIQNVAGMLDIIGMRMPGQYDASGRVVARSAHR